MERLKDALERLDERLDVLEAALARRLAHEGEIEASRQRLAIELDESKSAEARARTAAESVAVRLDGAIDRLQSVLEE